MSICYKCNNEDDTRPYGPKGEQVCFGCAMSPPESRKQTEDMFAVQLNACGSVSVLDGTDVGPYPLIAAAPEMLDLLKRIHASAQYWSEYDVPIGLPEDIAEMVNRFGGIGEDD